MVGSALRKDEASSVFWLATRAERLAHLAYSVLPALIQNKQKIAPSRLTKIILFLTMSQKVAWDSEKGVNINEFSEFIASPWTGKLKHNVRWISQRLKMDKSFLILIETKYFRYIMNPLLTKVIKSRWPESSIHLPLPLYGPWLCLYPLKTPNMNLANLWSSHLDHTVGN